MTNFKNLVATIAAMALVAISNCAFAQDDLDALLNALESGGKKPAAKAETPPAAEAPVAEAPAVAAAPSAAPAAPAAEAPAPAAEAPAAEAPALAAPAAEAPAAEAPAVAEAPAAAPAASKKEVDDVLNLLNELSAETPAQAPAAAPAPAEAPAAVAEAPAPAAEAPAVAAAPSAAPAASAAETPAPAPAPALANPADAELLANIRATEKLRRESLDAQAKREIEEARECMGNSEYTEAVKHYGLAAKLLNDRPSSKKLRKECEQGIAEGLYRAALQEDSLGRRERAEKLMEKALDMRHPKAKRTLDRWLAADAEESGKAEAADLKHRRSEDDYKESAEQIRRHLRRSRQYLSVRDMDKALEEVEVVLVNDPYNQEAIRLRNSIQRKRQTILRQERVASRDGMIADVDEAWRPVYAVNAAQLNSTASSTVKAKLGDDPERAQEQEILRRMHEMRLPAIAFKPPATIMDAVEFFRQASKDYDRPDIPVDSRGFNFVLKTPQPLKAAAATEEQDSDGFGAEAASDAGAAGNGLSQIPAINASNIPFDEALKLVCDQVDYKFIVRGSVVMVMHKDMSTAELISRKYDVLEAFLERMTAASSDVKEMKSQGFGGGGNKKDDGDENQERDWKEFFSQMGVKWPEGSSIMYIKTLGKLYVRNTLENLAEFEKVLVELGSQPKLIEIETRFVEVSQDDLNSLGFEWILNSDYSLNVGSGLSRALGLNSGAFGTLVDTAEGSSSWYDNQTRRSKAVDAGDTTVGGTWRRVDRIKIGEDKTIPDAPKAITKQNSKNIGINAFGGTSEQQNGNRYLSTVGNHISGESKSNNDQFMRINAFLGEADLSMILHMLAQRSDTDLLSAPKIVTKSGEEATIKVVTEYIYPQDYDVQLQSSSSSGSSSGGSGSSSAILAVVEPQNFTMREVGVILTVVPTYSEANGGTIDLELKPEVVDEPTWHNYGMRIPFTGNPSTMTTPSLEWLTSIGTEAVSAMNRAVTTLIGANASDIAKSYVDSGIASMNPSTLTYYDAPMEQPFFHTRKIDSKVSITPGSTVVMGGLITEARKAMDDKIPFLGDLPFIGRLFRSHSERTTKRNLLIFVTGRLITPSGRELKVGAEEEAEAEVKSAPQAE